MSSRPLLVTLAVLLAACGQSTAPDTPGTPPPLLTALPRPLTSAENTIVNASNTFTFRLLSQVSATAPHENVFLSPLSVSFALGMALNGAADQTHAEIATTLGLGGLSEPEINQGYAGLIALLTGLDPHVDVTIANSVWYHNTFDIRGSYLDALSSYFAASANKRDFRAQQTVVDINSWVSTQTGGKIPTIIDQISEEEIAFLINAIFFHGKWRVPFAPDKTQSAPFELISAQNVNVPIMFREDENLNFTVDENIMAASLPYGNGAFGMMLIRPNNSQSVNQLAAALDLNAWNSLRASLVTGKAVIRMPRFKLDFRKGLKDDLGALGMVRAFVPMEAEFPRIPATPSELFISRVQHRAAVEVTEAGTTAAAATVVGIGYTSAPPTLNFDQPFLFAIYERISGTILFAGKVVDPRG